MLWIFYTMNKDLNIHLTNKDIQIINKCIKNFLQLISSGNFKSKEKWNANMLLLDQYPEHSHQMLARRWSKKNFHSLLMEIQNGEATPEHDLVVSYKPKLLLLHHPAISFLGISPKELKTCFCKITCTQMFVAALWVICKP